jgi:hypothetical protein
MPAQAEQTIASGYFGSRGDSLENEFIIGLAFPRNRICIAPVFCGVKADSQTACFCDELSRVSNSTAQ